MGTSSRVGHGLSAPPEESLHLMPRARTGGGFPSLHPLIFSLLGWCFGAMTLNKKNLLRHEMGQSGQPIFFPHAYEFLILCLWVISTTPSIKLRIYWGYGHRILYNLYHRIAPISLLVGIDLIKTTTITFFTESIFHNGRRQSYELSRLLSSLKPIAIDDVVRQCKTRVVRPYCIGICHCHSFVWNDHLFPFGMRWRNSQCQCAVSTVSNKTPVNPVGCATAGNCLLRTARCAGRVERPQKSTQWKGSRRGLNGMTSCFNMLLPFFIYVNCCISGPP